MHFRTPFLPRSVRLPALGVATAALLLAGCAQVYDVKVDAMQNREVQPGHSFRIVVKEQGGASEKSQERAVALVRNALSGHGMYEAEKPEDAEVVVEVDYDVGPRRTVVQSEEPMLGLDTPATARMRGPYGTPMITERYPSAVITRQVYEKKLTIVARESRRATDGTERAPRELWRVEVKVDDEKDRVDDVLPVLVGAAVDHIGTDSATQRTKRVSDKSEPVNFVKGGS